MKSIQYNNIYIDNFNLPTITLVIYGPGGVPFFQLFKYRIVSIFFFIWLILITYSFLKLFLQIIYTLIFFLENLMESVFFWNSAMHNRGCLHILPIQWSEEHLTIAYRLRYHINAFFSLVFFTVFWFSEFRLNVSKMVIWMITCSIKYNTITWPIIVLILYPNSRLVWRCHLEILEVSREWMKPILPI